MAPNVSVSDNFKVRAPPYRVVVILMSRPQSQRVRHPGYRPQTTWRLPEIVSVGFFFFVILFLEGVAPTAYQNRMRASTDDHHVEESRPSNSSTFHPHENHEVAIGNTSAECDADTTSYFILSFLLMSFLVHDPFFCIARRPVFDGLPPNDLGSMNVRCPFCDALHWENECVSLSRVGHPDYRPQTTWRLREIVSVGF